MMRPHWTLLVNGAPCYTITAPSLGNALMVARSHLSGDRPSQLP